jgi:DNA repair protein RecN (Recombination protein N)
MLKSLRIQNYALISELEIDFYSGLSIITGETGAGKSILLGALSLILGQRADSSFVNPNAEKCVVEAIFSIHEYNLKAFFTDNDIDYDNEITLRREIQSNGKSRAFINDTPVNLNQLKELGLNLVDIHSQHENLNLTDDVFQLKVVDSIAGHRNLITEYNQAYRQYKLLASELQQLQTIAEKSKTDTDYFQFQFNQLEQASLVENEQEELESELETLTHAEEIKLNLINSIGLLSGDGASIINNIKEVRNSLSKILKFYSPASGFDKRAESVYIELKDLSREIELLSEKIEYNPDRIKTVNERLDLIYNLQQKHRVKSVSELIMIKNDFLQKLNEINAYDNQVSELKQKLDTQHALLLKLSKEISQNRNNVIPSIEAEIINYLQLLGMPNGKFKIESEKLKDFSQNGLDKIIFLFSANKHIELQEVSKIASGGEISRLMLSLKALIAEKTALPTIIFDEIDSGISGEIADKMGSIMQRMADHMQVINITHLPQIAGKGKYHYLVYKTESETTTTTNIKKLNTDERILEIAKMLSGEELTEAALSNARELLSN